MPIVVGTAPHCDADDALLLPQCGSVPNEHRLSSVSE
jgi:hypothetical protein